MTPSILHGRLVDCNSFGSHLAYMGPVQVRTKSSWISLICYTIPNGIVTTRWHCSLIATSTTRCSNFCTIEQPLTGIFRIGCREISLIYGVWHPYKHVCIIIWRKLFSLLSCIAAPVFGAGARAYDHPKPIVIEKTIDALLLAAPDIRAQLRQKLTLFEGRAHQAVLNTQDGLRRLRFLESLLNFYLPSIFVVGYLVRNFT